jgi:hypothetical protein
LVISQGRVIGAESSGLAASLLFAAGRRPEPEVIREFALQDGGFMISFDPSAERAVAPPDGEEPIWLELLSNGLTFDLVGLAPAAPSEPPPRAHSYAMPASDEATGYEAITVRPGPHLAGGHTMHPVVRSLSALVASLSAIEGVEAVAWHPARSWCGPSYFREGVLRWIEGGVFPGLGLTSLALTPDGGMQSEGLTLFAGQELRIEPDLMLDRAAGAKIGIRLIDYLVESGRIEERQRIVGPDGQPLRLEPSANGRFVRAWPG